MSHVPSTRIGQNKNALSLLDLGVCSVASFHAQFHQCLTYNAQTLQAPPPSFHEQEAPVTAHAAALRNGKPWEA